MGTASKGLFFIASKLLG